MQTWWAVAVQQLAAFEHQQEACPWCNPTGQDAYSLLEAVAGWKEPLQMAEVYLLLYGPVICHSLHVDRNKRVTHTGIQIVSQTSYLEWDLYLATI